MLEPRFRADACESAIGAGLLAAAILFGSPNVPQMVAAPPRIAGLDELVVHAPGTQPSGLPSIEFQNAPDGSVQVVIPQTVHVHKYYYSGDKEFQAPIIQGGPTIVVANHPRTSKRLYIDVNLPSGAPLIRHCKEGISYIYPDREVYLFFKKSDEKMCVEYKGGGGKMAASNARFDYQQKMAAKAAAKPKGPSAVSAAAKDLCDSTKNVVVGAAGCVGEASTKALKGAKAAVENFPLIRQLGDGAKQRAEEAQSNALQQAEARAEEAAPYIPTNRGGGT